MSKKMVNEPDGLRGSWRVLVRARDDGRVV